MTEQQQITPPLELKRQWREQAPRYRDGSVGRELWLIDHAAQWGADKELEACCAWLNGFNGDGEMLRIDRRPKPPSLKEQALEEVRAWQGMGTCNINIIIRALEALPK